MDALVVLWWTPWTENSQLVSLNYVLFLNAFLLKRKQTQIISYFEVYYGCLQQTELGHVKLQYTHLNVLTNEPF